MRKTPEEVKQRYELVLNLRPHRTFAEIGQVLGISGTTARHIYQRAYAEKARVHKWIGHMEHAPLQPTELRLLAMCPYVIEAAKEISELKAC